MSQPLVCCVLLTADREEMTARAVRCFEAQTYENRVLIVWNTGQPLDWSSGIPPRVWDATPTSSPNASIGRLRNDATAWALSGPDPQPDLFAHFDSDDWSHPNRLAEQVALIESDPELDAVGYSDMLFWKTVPSWDINPDGSRYATPREENEEYGEAWLYTSPSNYLLGTSLLYRRAAWERKPLMDINRGEDRHWIQGLRTKGVSSCPWEERPDPRMIASIHGANTSSRIDPTSEQWQRLPEWDQHCRETMELPVSVL